MPFPHPALQPSLLRTMGSSGEFSQILIVGQKVFINPCFTMISFPGRMGILLTSEFPDS